MPSVWYLIKLLFVSEYNLRKTKILIEFDRPIDEIDQYIPVDQLLSVKSDLEKQFRLKLTISDIDWALSWKIQLKLLLISTILVTLVTYSYGK